MEAPTAVALALLIALVPGRLGQLLRLGLQQLVEGFLHTARTSSLSGPLITSTFSCTIFSDMVCCLLSNVCVATSFYQSSAIHVFLSTFQFAKLILPYHLKSPIKNATHHL